MKNFSTSFDKIDENDCPAQSFDTELFCVYSGQDLEVRRLSIRGLLPDTDHYMTYDGSFTSPACHETVTWVVLNKPIYITKQQVSEWVDRPHVH